jgi:hypothetical protein
MKLVYCPYTDKELPLSETTPDHVIPLSLGGKNAFTIPMQNTFNSTIGHAKVIRAKQDARGHGHQPVEALWSRTTDQDGNPLQVTIGKDYLRVRDPKSGRILPDDETASLVFSSSFKMVPRARIPFSAKVALGTGYFLFDDIFRDHAAHQELRAVMQPLEELKEEALRGNRLKYFDPVHDSKNDRADPKHLVVEFMLRSLGCSGAVVSYAQGRLIFFIGILGEWFSTISVPAEDRAFPDTGDFDWGHVVALKSGGIVRLSFREAVKQLGEFMNHAQNETKSTGQESER